MVTDAGDSTELKPGQIVTARRLRDENTCLKRRDMRVVQVRDAVPATSTQILQGITRAALQAKSFIRLPPSRRRQRCSTRRMQANRKNVLDFVQESVIDE